jgi:gluconolactonase
MSYIEQLFSTNLTILASNFYAMQLILLLTLFLAMNKIQPGDNSLIKEGATLRKLATDFKFTEGPTSDVEGNVYFTDQPTNRILKWSTKGELTTYMEPAGRANGMFMDNKDNLWVCADEKNELWMVDSKRNIKVVVAGRYEDKLLNGPNDVWVSRSGYAYITDPFYAREWWDRKDMQQDVQGVYRLDKDHKTLTRVVNDMKQPNGIVGTPDGKKLYIADIGAGKTYQYTIGRKGELEDKKLFCSMGSDGMTIDNEGNVYLTHKDGVTVFSPKGEKLLNIPTGEGWTANVCFGGKDHSTLFITASKSLYAIDMNVKGVKP